MKIASIAEVKTQLSNYIKASEDGPIIITKHGQPVAMMLPILADDDLERLILAFTPRFRQLLDKADQRIKERGGINHDDFWAMVEAS